MWRILAISFMTSGFLVFLFQSFFDSGGENFLELGEWGAFFLNVIILLFSSDDMDWYTIPQKGVLILNILCYTGIIFFTLVFFRLLKIEIARG